VRALSPPVPRFGDRRVRTTPSFGILSTYPPTACGIATFSAALRKGLDANGADVGVVRVADGLNAGDRAVVGELDNGSPRSVAAASQLLNRYDVAIVQHEYGLYGGVDGDEVLEVLEGLEVPSIVIAHTILSHPSPHQRSVLEAVAAAADQVIVMSDAAQERLCELFDVDPEIVTTIPHGAAIPTGRAPHASEPRPTILTWGLIGPGKGIERVIDAMASLHQLPCRPRYLVAGQTHPRVLAADGEAYRNARIEQAARIGVADSVVFDATYRDVASLTSLIQSCAVVVLPYDTADQVTSGVLVDAIAAGRPVIATAFPHAVELLATGAGIVVDHDDPAALVSALRRVLVEPGLADSMAAEAARLAPHMGWSVVARAYAEMGQRLLSKQPVLV
jgi:glycosyltransferase involved in cell wall biosynthesis